MALSPSKELDPWRVPLGGLAVDRVDRGDVVAADDLVAEAVAGQALARAVADVVQARVHGSWAVRRLDECQCPPT